MRCSSRAKTSRNSGRVEASATFYAACLASLTATAWPGRNRTQASSSPQRFSRPLNLHRTSGSALTTTSKCDGIASETSGAPSHNLVAGCICHAVWMAYTLFVLSDALAWAHLHHLNAGRMLSGTARLKSYHRTSCRFALLPVRLKGCPLDLAHGHGCRELSLGKNR